MSKRSSDYYEEMKNDMKKRLLDDEEKRLSSMNKYYIKTDENIYDDDNIVGKVNTMNKSEMEELEKIPDISIEGLTHTKEGKYLGTPRISYPMKKKISKEFILRNRDVDDDIEGNDFLQIDGGRIKRKSKRKTKKQKKHQYKKKSKKTHAKRRRHTMTKKHTRAEYSSPSDWLNSALEEMPSDYDVTKKGPKAVMVEEEVTRMMGKNNRM